MSGIVNAVRLAEILDISPDTVRHWRRAGIIPGIPINRTVIRYDVDEVIAALKRRAHDRSEKQWAAHG